MRLLHSPFCTVLFPFLFSGVVQTALSVYHFSEQAHTDLEFYLENTNGQFDTRVKNMENMIISFSKQHNIKAVHGRDMNNIEEVREQFISAADLFSEANVVNSVHPFVDCVYLFNSKGKWVNSQFLSDGRRKIGDTKPIFKRNQREVHEK